MLAADAELELGLRRPPFLDGDLHQRADAITIERDERVLRQDAALDILRQELAGVVARRPNSGLGQVVGAEAEEVGIDRRCWSASKAARGSSIMVPT